MSSGYSVTITGIDELLKRLDAVRDSKVLSESLESIGQELVTKNLMQYPPVPAGSKYRRTNKLRGSWTHRVINDGEVLQIGNSNSVPYNRYVMDRDMQTKVHQWHGWKTVQGILQLRLDWITNTIKKDIQKALDGRG